MTSNFLREAFEMAINSFIADIFPLVTKYFQVRFSDPVTGWEGWGQFGPADVHKQYAISLLSPAYSPLAAPPTAR